MKVTLDARTALWGMRAGWMAVWCDLRAALECRWGCSVWVGSDGGVLAFRWQRRLLRESPSLVRGGVYGQGWAYRGLGKPRYAAGVAGDYTAPALWSEDR